MGFDFENFENEISELKESVNEIKDKINEYDIESKLSGIETELSNIENKLSNIENEIRTGNRNNDSIFNFLFRAIILAVLIGWSVAHFINK